MEKETKNKKLSKLEKDLSHCVKIVDQLIKVTSENINRLTNYVNHKHSEIENLIRKKRTRIVGNCYDDRNRMTLFYDNTYGNVPSNEDAMKMDEHLSSLSKIRKKYEYKEKVWSKRMLKLLFENVDKVSKRYACKYLINHVFPKHIIELKKKEIEEMDANQVLHELHSFFETQKEEEPIMTKCGEKNSEDTEKLEKKNEEPNFTVFMQQFWDEISQNLNKEYNRKDCQTAWVHHRCFEKENKEWNEEEIKNLLFLCKKYNNKNWLSIARELNTNRSPLCCFEKYIKISKLYKKEESTKTERQGYNVIEDIQLQLLVSILGDNDWGEVKNFMQYLNPHIKRVGAIEYKRDAQLNNNLGKQSSDSVSYKRRYYRLINVKQNNVN